MVPGWFGAWAQLLCLWVGDALRLAAVAIRVPRLCSYGLRAELYTDVPRAVSGRAVATEGRAVAAACRAVPRGAA